MSTRVPPLLVGLVDDASAVPPCTVTLSEAVAGHTVHRTAWYADMVGPLLLTATQITEAVDHGSLPGLTANVPPLAVGVVADDGPAPRGLDRVVAAVAAGSGPDPGPDPPPHPQPHPQPHPGAAAWLRVRHVEIPVAMRGDDPIPGLSAVIEAAGSVPAVTFYAEIPLTWGVLASLDQLAEARAAGVDVAPKFRTGGLAAELFPTPIELAAVICACRDRALPFKLTTGLHRAIRRTDPETGLVNHGFMNVLAAVLAADAGAEAADLAELLGGTDPGMLVEVTNGLLGTARPLWRGFGTCGVGEPLADLRSLGLLPVLPTALS